MYKKKNIYNFFLVLEIRTSVFLSNEGFKYFFYLVWKNIFAGLPWGWRGGGEIDFLLITSIFHQSRGEEESLKTNKLKRHPPGSFNFSIANATDRVYSNANAIDRVLISD